MSTGTITDVLSRIDTIQQQIQAVESGSLPQVVGTGQFASQLAAAQGAGVPAASGAAAGGIALGALSGLATTAGASYGGSLSSASGSSVVGTALPASASSQLTSAQQQFASTLAAQTGLNPGVVSAWLLAEESGGAAQARQAQGNNDWLNIGYTGAGTYGAGDAIWSNPVAAATATAQWLDGQNSIPGYGPASAGVRSIMASVGQNPAAQVQAIQQSGWSASGYPSLPEIYQQLAG